MFKIRGAERIFIKHYIGVHVSSLMLTKRFCGFIDFSLCNRHRVQMKASIRTSKDESQPESLLEFQIFLIGVGLQD